MFNTIHCICLNNSFELHPNILLMDFKLSTIYAISNSFLRTSIFSRAKGLLYVFIYLFY